MHGKVWCSGNRHPHPSCLYLWLSRISKADGAWGVKGASLNMPGSVVGAMGGWGVAEARWHTPCLPTASPNCARCCSRARGPQRPIEEVEAEQDEEAPKQIQEAESPQDPKRMALWRPCCPTARPSATACPTYPG